jgi:hypothetical protein
MDMNTVRGSFYQALVARSAKRIGLLTVMAGAVLCPISWAGTVSILTSSGSQDSVGHNVFVNANIANGTPDPGNGATGTPGWLAGGTATGDQFTDSTFAQSTDPDGITSGLAMGSASLLNATVRAYTAASNSIGFGYNSSGYQTTERVHDNWSESLTFAPLPGQPVGSLVPVQFNIFAHLGFFEDTATSAFTSFDYSVQLPDIRDSLGNSFGAQVRWLSNQSSDGFGDINTFDLFCLVNGACSNAPSFSGTSGSETFQYALGGALGVMSDIVQGYAVSGSPFELGMGLQAISYGDSAYIDFANTGWLTIDSPSSFTSESGVFLSQPYTQGSAAPEPATVLYLVSGLAAIAWRRRRSPGN